MIKLPPRVAFVVTMLTGLLWAFVAYQALQASKHRHEDLPLATNATTLTTSTRAACNIGGGGCTTDSAAVIECGGPNNPACEVCDINRPCHIMIEEPNK